MSFTQADGKNTEQHNSPVFNTLHVLHNAGRKHFIQNNIWEVCLCSIIAAIDPKCKLYKLVESLPAKDDLLNENSLLNVLAHLGYVAKKIDIENEEIDERLLPILVISKERKPVVLLRKEEDGLYQSYEPDTLSLVKTDIDKKNIKQIWFFERFDEVRSELSPFMRKGSGHSWFGALLGRFRGTFTQVIVAGLFLNLIALVTPLFIMAVYDRVISTQSIDTLLMLCVGVGLAIIFEFCLRQIRSQGLSWLAGRMDNIVGNKIFSHLIGLSPSLIERASVSSQIARIKTFESIRDFFSGSVFLSLLEIPFVIIALAVIYVIAGSLAVVPVVMVFAYLTLFWVVQSKVKIAIRLAAKASSARQSFTIEIFEKMRGIRSYGLTGHCESKFRDLSGKEMYSHFYLGWLGLIAENIAHALTLISVVATVGFGVHLIWAGAMSTGALVASMILVWRILTPFYSLCTMIPRLEQLRNSIAQVNNLMDIDTEATESKSYARLTKMKGGVEFNQVRMRYKENSDLVFEDVTFKMNPGDFVVISGDNGSGKTTLLKMIKGMYGAEHGAVRIDGFDIRQLDASNLRRQIAYVPQQPDFFKGRIIDNLRIGNPLATLEDAKQALILADAWEEIEELPEQIFTEIKSNSEKILPSSLSVKLSLARAYLHSASLILIDELPNTLMRGKTGENLKKYIEAGKGKRTCLMVSYNKEFVELADFVVMLRRSEKPIVGKNYILINELNTMEAA